MVDFVQLAFTQEKSEYLLTNKFLGINKMLRSKLITVAISNILYIKSKTA